MRTPAGRGSGFRSCLSAHRAVSRGTRSEGEEEGAGEVCQIRGARGSFCFTSDRTPQALWRSGFHGKGRCQDASNQLKAPKQPQPHQCCAASPALSVATFGGLRLQLHTRDGKRSLSARGRALAGCSCLPQLCECWAGLFDQPLDAGRSSEWGRRVQCTTRKLSLALSP